MISTLNPLAAEFIPAQVAQIQDQESQDQDGFYEVNQYIEKFKELRALEAQVKEIPKITNYDDLQQVAQIQHHTITGPNLYELFWNGQHAILDSSSETSSCSWQYPDMTIRHILQHYFDQNIIIKGEYTHDTDDYTDDLMHPSSTPAIQLHVISA